MRLNTSLTAVVTGGAGRLGAAVARALAGAGVRVALFDIAESRGLCLAREIGGLFCDVDVSSTASLEAGLATSRRLLGQERILLNAARTDTRDIGGEGWPQTALVDYDRAVQVELVGAVRCIEAVAPRMQDLEQLEEGERGVIVNCAWLHGRHKLAADGFLAIGGLIARELVGTGVRLNTITSAQLPNAGPALCRERVGQSPADREEAFVQLALTLIRHPNVSGAIVPLEATPNALH